MGSAVKSNWKKWVSKAEEAENRAHRLDEEAHSHPKNNGLFLKAAKYSRKSAEYQRFASQSTDNFLLKSVALSNYHIMKGNAYKSLGNFFYYSSKPSKAARFFERAAAHHALSTPHIPRDLSNYQDLVQDSIANEMELRALVANCNGMTAKLRENWAEALEHFRREKEKWEGLKSLGGNYVRSLNIDAAIKSTEREIQICRAMISLNNFDFPQALKYAESALSAARKMLQEQPNWVYYQEALMSTVSLKETLTHIMSVLKASPALKAFESKLKIIMEENQSYLDNLVSYKFTKEVESYLRREHQYSNTRCNYKPPYLGHEIDVYASKGEQKITITICECRLRLGDRPLSADEIKEFSELSRTVRKYEQCKAIKEGKQVTVYAWLVTNTDLVEDRAFDIARENNIEIKQAIIPRESRRLYHDVTWTVSDIRSLR